MHLKYQIPILLCCWLIQPPCLVADEVSEGLKAGAEVAHRAAQDAYLYEQIRIQRAQATKMQSDLENTAAQREQDELAELLNFQKQKFDHYVLDLELINIEREKHNWAPIETLTFPAWAHPVGLPSDINEPPTTAKSIIAACIRYSDYWVTATKLNVERLKVKLKPKVIKTYLQWAEDSGEPYIDLPEIPSASSSSKP